MTVCDRDHLEVLGLDQAVYWDELVRSFPLHDAYWLSGYARGLMLHGDGEPLLFHYDDGTTRGVSVSMRRRLSDEPWFQLAQSGGYAYDLATPYGYGGWLIEGDGTTALFECYENWCRGNGVVSEFVRFHPVVGNAGVCGDAYDVVPLGHTVTMDLSSPSAIWENMTSKCRNMVRKAEKRGLRVYNGRSADAYHRFRQVYDATMKRDGADGWYYFDDTFYASILEDLPSVAEVFWAEVPGGETAAASIMLECNGMMSYHLSGSLREYLSWAPTNLILYRAALWGCEHGMRSLHLGGGLGSSEDDGLFRFKRSFHKGELTRFGIGRKVFDQSTYNNLVEMRGGDIRSHAFFPEYRG